MDKRKQNPQDVAPTTSWESVEKWYRNKVGDDGHYFHQHLILPGLQRLMNLRAGDSVLDLACGDGILGRQIANSVSYTGIDAAPSFIKAARKMDHSKSHEYMIGDVTQPLLHIKKKFTHATIILAIQNIEEPKKVFENAAMHLIANGTLIIVMNHPCFRIPRQSSWKIDEEQNTQYRRVDKYFTPMKIPIQTHPGKENSPETWSFHQPLSSYTKMLWESGFTSNFIEEWCSDKISTGKFAKMENRCRREFPLFLTIIASKR